MFGNSYNCFIAGLPEIALDDKKLSLSVQEFREQSLDYIRGKDKMLLDLFFLPNDHKQLLLMMNKQEPDIHLQTVFSVKILEEELLEPLHLPDYLKQFIFDYKDESLPTHQSVENTLSERYYDYLLHVDNNFIRKYGEFVMNVRNLVTAINCRKYKLDINQSIIGDNEFSTILKSSNLKDFGLSMDYSYVERVVALMENSNLVERERGIDMLIWDFIDDILVFEYFSIEKVIGYLLKLMIVERWSKMETESGREVFMELVQRFRKEFIFDENKQVL